MPVTTDAIVLSLQPSSDKAHTLHAYTRTGGRVAYKVFGLGRRHPIGMYGPLSLLQLTTDTLSVRTAQLTFVPQALNTDPSKRAVTLFISEVLFHTLRYPMADERMFDFIASSIRRLDETKEPQNFHLQFLSGFAAQLGFARTEQLPVPSTRAERQQQLRDLCDYFAEHVETWQQPKSFDILMEVFD